ncbi:MAG: ROK family protein [Acidimicrobiales bacterium]
MASDGGVIVGLDNGGTTNNATVLDSAGEFLVSGLVESPSRVREGTDAALDALEGSLRDVLELAGVERSRVRAVGLDSPGPASADGVICSQGATNFEHPSWHGFDLRGHLETRLGVSVVYSNDGNAAALYAHRRHFGTGAPERSSVSVVIGTGLGGGIIERGGVVKGATGTAGELGHVHIPMDGILEPGQPVPRCNCGFIGDAESVASLAGIERNLLPYWLARFPEHELASVRPPAEAAKLVRTYGEAGDPMALRIFEQQAAALGALLTIVANVVDPDAYFVGGGVVQASPAFGDWFLEAVKAATRLREEAAATAVFALASDLDLAGARGAALAASAALP